MDLPKPKTVLRPPKPKIIQKVEKYFESQKKSESKHEEEQNKGKDLQPKNQDQRVKQIMDDIDQAIEESSQGMDWILFNFIFSLYFHIIQQISYIWPYANLLFRRYKKERKTEEKEKFN